MVEPYRHSKNKPRVPHYVCNRRRAIALGIGLQILSPDLHEDRDPRLERRLRDFVGQLSCDPRIQRVELTREGPERLGLRDGIIPVHVERALDARLQEQENAGLATHRLLLQPEQAGRTATTFLAACASKLNASSTRKVS